VIAKERFQVREFTYWWKDLAVEVAGHDAMNSAGLRRYGSSPTAPA
jgi:hypothetical protein